ncbi:MAG: DNA ligase (ATP) [Rhodanobacteraceae bacterium]|jgi:DNA ligase-1|nr:MAG: DNA ligase (ATP) [Rhodanobacteraceae bacterium]
MRPKRWIVAVFMVWAPAVSGMARSAPPPVELVDVYHGGVDLSRYWVSEKFDGVRGYWNGHQLLTRGGAIVHVPAWFTEGWPKTPLDGELWVGYGQFSRVSAIVRTADANDPAWHQVTYQVFDLPAQGGDFDARVPAIRKTVAAIGDPWVVAIRQFRVASETQLYAELKRVLDKGGEGLVLHRGDTPYRVGRGVGLLKLKPYEDAEARVVAILPGQGRLAGKMGSIEVRTPDGYRFSIGSGFSDADRADPPPVGSWVTYRFNGRTATGLPRFARFLRRRPEGPPPEVDPSNAGRPP